MGEELRIRLLGSPAVSVGDQPVSGFVSIKSRALLYYLAATGGTHRRDALAALLWSDVLGDTSRKNLRDVLSNLRRLVGPFLLIMSVFGTTMTAFALVGSTGESFKRGVGVYGMLASSSGIIHSLCFFVIGDFGTGRNLQCIVQASGDFGFCTP